MGAEKSLLIQNHDLIMQNTRLVNEVKILIKSDIK
jgi:hypothetical protein